MSAEEEGRSNRSRRTFLRRSAIALSGLLFGSAARSAAQEQGQATGASPPSPAQASKTPKKMPAGKSGTSSAKKQAGGGSSKPLARIADVPANSALQSTYRGQPVMILNVGGTVKVFSAICPHEGCLVTWNKNLGQIQCPCHDGLFDRDGKVAAGPPPAPLLRLRAVVRNGAVYVAED